MQLTEPTYLWALLGLLIPLAIHLLSRKAGKVVKVGSIRHLMDANTRKFSSLRFNEYLLFSLRSLSVVLLVLILSGLIWGNKKTQSKWVLLETETRQVPALQKSLDSLVEAGYELRYWATGFPLLEETPSLPAKYASYPQLLNELEQTGVEAIIYTRNRLAAFQGQQLALSNQIRWLQLPGRKRQANLQAVRLTGDSVLVLRGITGPDQSSFFHSIKNIPLDQTHLNAGYAGTDELAIETLPPIRILILKTAETDRQTKLLKAAILALKEVSGRKITLSEATIMPDSLKQYDVVVNARPRPGLANSTTKWIHFSEHPKGPVSQQTGPDTWTIRQDLDRQAIMRENLLVSLGGIFFQDEELTKRIRDWDERTIDESLFFKQAPKVVQAGSLKAQSMDKWLILALILLFITERILAFYRQA